MLKIKLILCYKSGHYQEYEFDEDNIVGCVKKGESIVENEKNKLDTAIIIGYNSVVNLIDKRIYKKI